MTTTSPTALTDAFKQQLLAQRASLLDQIATLRGGAVSRAKASNDHYGHSEDSQAQTNSERELELALDDRETLELQQVEAALLRIATGTYGQCVDCAGVVPAARLHAAPEAARCIACQDMYEHSH